MQQQIPCPMRLYGVSPAAAHLVTISKEQLEEDLPYYGKDALFILEQADEFILAEDMPDSLPRHVLLQQRISQIKRGDV